MKSILKVFFLLMLAANFCFAQEEKVTIDDYTRAVGFLNENLVNKRVFNLHVEPNWFSDSTGFWYIIYGENTKRYKKVVLDDLHIEDLFNHELLAKILEDSLGETVDARNLPISGIEYLNPSELSIRVQSKSYVLDVNHYTLENPESTAPVNRFEEFSPDKKWVAYTEDYNLFIKSTETDEVRQLSQSGEKYYEYASWYGWADIIYGENGERPKRFGAEWSPDGEWIFANICDLRTADKMYLLDWSIDSLYRPQLLSYYRGSPGDTNMVRMEPVFFNVKTGEEIRTPLPIGTHINSTSMDWTKTPGNVILAKNTRGYQEISFYSFNFNTKEIQTLYREESDTNIDNFRFEYSEDGRFMFFLSEKSGWRQLYRLDLESKEVLPLTQGEYYVNSIGRIDNASKKIYFLASGKEEGRNPYYQHLYSVSFSGRGQKLLTPENLHHRVSLSPDTKYFVDNFSTVTSKTQTVLRESKSGKIISKLSEADVSGIDRWSPPEIFKTTARDGHSDIYGAIWKPTNFDPSKKYPVIELSYTGPHTQLFPKDFSRAFGLQSYAELGFVCVIIDGLGSSGRSKDFHNYSYKNLGGNLEDHVLAIKAMGDKYSWMDVDRVGIFGHSAGGYDAGHAVLAYPDFYKVAVASSADHDHRMEKAWWPEMYMGWPVDSAYHNQSNITMAGNLKGKLLITHGGIDENVNPSATFKLAEALIKADKQFDMIILPSQRHGYGGDHRNYFVKSRWNYFLEHLRGVEPIWDFPWK